MKVVDSRCVGNIFPAADESPKNSQFSVHRKGDICDKKAFGSQKSFMMCVRGVKGQWGL